MRKGAHQIDGLDGVDGGNDDRSRAVPLILSALIEQDRAGGEVDECDGESDDGEENERPRRAAEDGRVRARSNRAAGEERELHWEL